MRLGVADCRGVATIAVRVGVGVGVDVVAGTQRPKLLRTHPGEHVGTGVGDACAGVGVALSAGCGVQPIGGRQPNDV